MNHNMQSQDSECQASTAPSAEFINAISEFFDTDPSDLLAELGYYNRDASGRSEAAVSEVQ